MMIDIFIWVVSIFLVWNVVAICLVYTRRWVDRNKQDIVKCKWTK
jgi:hypothetical protein